ncbi:unnamed protein product, partial [Ectocarpus sp. 12 AP-2014]
QRGGAVEKFERRRRRRRRRRLATWVGGTRRERVIFVVAVFVRSAARPRVAFLRPASQLLPRLADGHERHLRQGLRELGVLLDGREVPDSPHRGLGGFAAEDPGRPPQRRCERHLSPRGRCAEPRQRSGAGRRSRWCRNWDGRRQWVGLQRFSDGWWRRQRRR